MWSCDPAKTWIRYSPAGIPPRRFVITNFLTFPTADLSYDKEAGRGLAYTRRATTDAIFYTKKQANCKKIGKKTNRQTPYLI